MVVLITYEQQSMENFPIIGYEYTILSRFLNYTDYASKIIDIPFNEYHISCFGQGSSPEHYYSIFLPDNIEKVIIQLDGNYFEAFYEDGRKKINTLDKEANKLDIKDNKNVINLNRMDFKQRALSFAFRSKDYFSKTFSYYYFRVLYTKKNEVNYLPMDSNFGNLCLPKFNLETGSFYCNFILKNNYNELKTNFSISLSNQNELVKINIFGIHKNETLIINLTNYSY